MKKYDVVIIGGGPAGSIAAAKLNRTGCSVLILEKSQFPRFVIGESLLPQCMDYLKELDLLDTVSKEGFQVKTGACFFHNERTCEFNFEEQYTKGWDYTYQVKRADFDQALIRAIEDRGVEIEYQATVTNFKGSRDHQCITYTNKNGNQKQVESNFVVDASGFGRVLPRLLNLSTNTTSVPRGAVYSHFSDNNKPNGASNNIYVHSFNENTAWVWSIPFSDETASVGIVGNEAFIQECAKEDGKQFKELITTFPMLEKRFSAAKALMPVKTTMNYAKGVKQLYGDGFVLCGNATEFLDPIFSSGVTLAMASGYKAAELIAEEIQNKSVDWEEYNSFVYHGVDVFRSYVNAWYEGTLPSIFFASKINEDYKKQICSVLAGYVWDESNPFVKKHENILDTLAKVISFQN